MTERPDSTATNPTDDARTSLDTITKGWRHVLDPIETTTTGSTRTGPRPATEDEADQDLPPDARYDTPITLAFWVHAALDKWPTILQTLQPVDPDQPDGDLHLVTTETIDCTDVPAMAALLHREAARITDWTEPGHDFGHTFTTELAALARAVSRVAWPPKGDRITIGECTCGRRLRVKAPAWRKRPLSVPQPTTDPDTYPEWTWIIPDDAVWEVDRDKPITCRCGIEDTVEGWHGRLVPFEDRTPKTADELVVIIHERMSLRYQPLTVRTWARRGLIKVAGYSADGHATYDVTQVLAALTDREKRRDRDTGGRMAS